MREIARLALSADWTLDTGLAVLGDADIDAIIVAYRSSMRPMIETETFEIDPKTKRHSPVVESLRDWLKPIGMKIRPEMSESQCGAWLTAMALALSNLPAKISVQAARAAIHIPMGWLNEVEKIVRDEAAKLLERHDTAMRRLVAMREQIRRAQRPQTALPAPPPLPSTITDAEIIAMPDFMRRMGVRVGILTEQQIIAAGCPSPPSYPDEVARGLDPRAVGAIDVSFAPPAAIDEQPSQAA